MTQTPTRIADYAGTAGARLRATAEGSGRQPGDPVRAAQAIIDVASRPSRRATSCWAPSASTR